MLNLETLKKIFKIKTDSSENENHLNQSADVSLENMGRLQERKGDMNSTESQHRASYKPYLFWDLKETEAIFLCKHQIDTMEHWSRRLIDETMRENYGKDYFSLEVKPGQPLVKKEIIAKINGRMKSDPGRFPRKIDAIVIEDLEYFFCRDDLYRRFFKTVFEPFYSGQNEVRSVIKRISDIRNKYSHGNPISQHEIEQAVCYTNDIIGVFMSYYQKCGKEKKYNVPTILAIKDSFGRCLVREDQNDSWRIREVDMTKGNNAENQVFLRSGESYRFEVEVDASFPEDFYKVEWYAFFDNGKDGLLAKGKGRIIEFRANDESVSSRPQIIIKLTTKRTWHRFGHIKCDDFVEYEMNPVLPPIEDTY